MNFVHNLIINGYDSTKQAEACEAFGMIYDAVAYMDFKDSKEETYLDEKFD